MTYSVRMPSIYTCIICEGNNVKFWYSIVYFGFYPIGSPTLEKLLVKSNTNPLVDAITVAFNKDLEKHESKPCERSDDVVYCTNIYDYWYKDGGLIPLRPYECNQTSWKLLPKYQILCQLISCPYPLIDTIIVKCKLWILRVTHSRGLKLILQKAPYESTPWNVGHVLLLPCICSSL